MPALTIGMAVFNDFNGVYFTIQALRMYHDLRDVELIVVDNNPTSPDGRGVRTLMENYARHWTAGARYIPYTEKIGTSAPRQKVFEEASGEAVICIDSHILIAAGAIERLIAYYKNNPDCKDILSGPMIMDDITTYESEFQDQWRAEMWGIWGHDPRAAFPIVPPVSSASLAHLSPGKPVPPYAWTEYDNQPPFEIPAMGLGLFSCRKSAWLGFNPHFTGFGGEEFYIHNKFRQAGHKALCLPFLRWLHRFPRPNGIQYPLTRWQKIRNYVIGHQELGLPIDRIYEHFVTPQKHDSKKPEFALMTETEWAYLLEDPVAHTRPKDSPAPCTTCPPAADGLPMPASNLPQPPDNATLNQMFDDVKGHHRKVNRHMDKLRELASKSPVVVEFSTQRETTLALLAGGPRILLSWNREQDQLMSRLHTVLSGIPPEERATQKFTTSDGMSLITDIPECDLLYLDTMYTAERITAELKLYAKKVRKYIAIFSTSKYGEVGAHNGPGLLPGIREWLRNNPTWRVSYHTDEQDGLTVLNHVKEEAPALPSTPQMIFNYASFLVKHTLGGGGLATEETVKLRLDTCALCPMRTADSKRPDLPRCSKCGCFLVEGETGNPGKALLRNAQCPLGFWRTAEQLGRPIVPLTEKSTPTLPKENPAPAQA